MWVRVNLSSLPAELYPHIQFAVLDSFSIIAHISDLSSGFFRFFEIFLYVFFFAKNTPGRDLTEHTPVC